VSGVRRFISFRRKAAKQQEGEKEAGEEDLVDHRKSTAEEEQTKVSGFTVSSSREDNA
jgi:DNA-directed RNA polymerase delta subunit